MIKKIHAVIVKSLNAIDEKYVADKIFCSGTSCLSIIRLAVLETSKRSGLSVDDKDVFEVHDCFTSS